MEQKEIKIDKNVLAPEDFENTKLVTLDDGSMEEVYISRAGNIVTNPKDRTKDMDVSKRQLCWDLYVKSLSQGRPSARQAAIDAGFSLNTAINIRSMKWFKEKVAKLQRSRMLSKAERNISKILDLEYSKMVIKEDGTEDTQIDKDILNVVANISTKVATHLGKDEGWSTKTEVEGNMSGDIKINSISYADSIKEIEGKVVENAIDSVEEKVIEVINEKNEGDNITT